jgi:hypothetical protein
MFDRFRIVRFWPGLGFAALLGQSRLQGSKNGKRQQQTIYNRYVPPVSFIAARGFLHRLTHH